MGKKKAAKATKERKGKKIRKGRKHQSVKIYQFYEVKGNSLERKRKFCPRCGEGTVLSSHKNRAYCGRCGYTELNRNPEKK